MFGEVFPLENRMWKVLHHALHKRLDKRIVVGPTHALVAPTQVKRVVQQRLVVGTNIKNDGQRGGRMNARADGVEGEFTDGDAHPTNAQITEAENPLAVGDDDHAHIGRRSVGEHGVEEVTLRIGQVKPPGAAVDVAVLLTSQTNGGRVNDRSHLDDMLRD